MPNKAKAARTDETIRDEIKTLRARVKELEAILKCVRCGHLRSEHDDDFAPCFGGRAKDAKPGEGEYCMCPGYECENDGGASQEERK